MLLHIEGAHLRVLVLEVLFQTLLRRGGLVTDLALELAVPRGAARAVRLPRGAA